MFGKRDIPALSQQSVRPPAAERAQIQGGGLVQVIVSSITPFTYYIFLNQLVVPQDDIESFSLSIEAPGSDGGQQIAQPIVAWRDRRGVVVLDAAVGRVGDHSARECQRSAAYRR